jgi:hypothetical protein
MRLQEEKSQILGQIGEMERRGRGTTELIAQIQGMSLREQEAQSARQALYGSDPSWLMSFTAWCNENNPPIENGVEDPLNLETDLRRDVNGWFQHLRSCETPARRDWMAVAEVIRDAITAGDRCRYDYIPLRASAPGDGPASINGAISFRQYCTNYADPHEIQVSPMNSVFINLLHGYAGYLKGNGFYDDVREFLCEREKRVKLLRQFFAAIPGAPLSGHPHDHPVDIDSPSLDPLVEDIQRLCAQALELRRLDELRIAIEASGNDDDLPDRAHRPS